MSNKSIPTKAYNETLITLILKSLNEVFPVNCRPIRLCNTTYKILAKIICNRLKAIPLEILNQTQGAFIQGKCVIDNVYVTL